MLERYQEKYRQEKLAKSHAVTEPLDHYEEKRKQVEFVKEQFPTVSEPSSRMQSEYDPDDTIQSSVQEYICRNKTMTVTEGNDTSHEKTISSKLTSTASSHDITNFIKTYNLESTIGNLDGSLGGSILKNTSTKMEQWIVIAHKIAEHL